MIYEYKITSSSKNKYFYKILLTTLLIHLVILSGYFYFEKIKDLNLMGIIFSGVIFGWLLIFGLPVILLYFNHYKHSKNVILKYDDDKKMYVYSNSLKNFNFNVDDIIKIELCLTSSAYEKRTDWLFIAKYHYASIYTKQNQEIVISCLVCDEVKEIFPESLIVKKGKFLPQIPGKIKS